MEEKVKNRAWVKDAAIIFLAVLLVLTFFSSTIMNRSLTEAATQEIKSGSITAKVRGKGLVVANGENKVKANGTVTIAKVMVKAGDEVKTDDVLFVLGAGDSDELTAAKETLEDLELSYQQAIANLPINDGYYSEMADIRARERAIAIAQEELEKAKQTIQADPGDTEIEKLLALQTKLNEEIEALTKQRDELQNKETELTTNLTEAETFYKYVKSLYEQETSANGSLEAAKAAFDAAELNCNYALEKLNKANEELANASAEEIEEKTKAVEKANAELNAATSAKLEAQVLIEQAQTAAEAYIEHISQADVEAAKTAMEKAQSEYTNWVNAGNRTVISQNEKDIADKNVELSAVETKLENWGAGSSNYIYILEKQNALENAKDAYNAAIASLQYSQAMDGKSYNSSYLSAQAIQIKIDRQKELIKELAGEGEENTIVAQTAGIVSEVNCASGDSVVKGDILAVIEVPDMGYTISFSVTNDQARRLKVGDKATISNFYWGNEITATLKSIATDKKNPQSQKLLTFDLEGDVTSGSELTVSVGQKSAGYDFVVPNSAIRNDNNGTFIYVIEAKNSPVGNRYMAKRVKAEVLASDDTNSAISADVENGDFVITTTGAPIKNGEQVRLANQID